VAAAWGLPTADGTRTEVALPAFEWAALFNVLTQAERAGVLDADRLRDLIRGYFGG
jgi:hypothetical protein